MRISKRVLEDRWYEMMSKVWDVLEVMSCTRDAESADSAQSPADPTLSHSNDIEINLRADFPIIGLRMK